METVSTWWAASVVYVTMASDLLLIEKLVLVSIDGNSLLTLFMDKIIKYYLYSHVDI